MDELPGLFVDIAVAQARAAGPVRLTLESVRTYGNALCLRGRVVALVDDPARPARALALAMEFAARDDRGGRYWFAPSAGPTRYRYPLLDHAFACRALGGRGLDPAARALIRDLDAIRWIDGGGPEGAAPLLVHRVDWRFAVPLPPDWSRPLGGR